jgi:hypothetical protein
MGRRVRGLMVHVPLRRALLTLSLVLAAGCGPEAPPAEPVLDVVMAPGGVAQAGLVLPEGPPVGRFVEPEPEPGQLAAPALEDRWVEGPGFHYAVPGDWENLDPTTMGSSLIRSAQRSAEATADFKTNVNVATEPFSGDGPSYGTANIAELQKVCTVKKERRTMAGPRTAMDIESHWDNPGGVPYVTVQRYATNGAEGFVLTCAAAASAFERQRGLCMQILDSFRVD